MYLKSLTLKGFKSFADRTHMVFDPGLTVVVGPNGSGKSNVSDSILWVLGEQSAKMLRGQAMEDIIFSGSSARKPVGVAEVTLVLDNSDHTLPIDFDEVAVTRRMYRSGESEYLVNDAPARLMDIQDILHDSGLGKDTHSIISQGKLDSVLSSRPEDRRALIEEAAGISKHRRRKERSARKLKSMAENLTRAKDIEREINRQLRPLERQVDKAKRAGDIQARLGEASTVLAVDDLRRLQEQWNKLSARDKEAEAAIELARFRADEKSQELEKLQSLLEQKGLFVGDLGEQRRRMQDALGRMESDMRLLEEKGKNMVARLSEMRMSLSGSDRRRAEAVEEQESARRELEQVRVTAEHLSSELAQREPAAKEASAAVREKDKDVAKLSSQLGGARRRADQETLAHARLSEQIEAADLEESMFKSRLEQIEETEQMAREAQSQRSRAKAELQESETAQTNRREQLSHDIDEATAALAEATSSRDAAREELSQARASLSALRAVEERSHATSPLAGAIAQDEAASAAIDARLGDFIQAPTELEPLIERLLGSDLNALVVRDDDGLRSLAAAVRGAADASGQAVALSLEASSDNPPAGEGERLCDLIEVPDRAQALIEALLGDVYVLDTFDEALAAHASAPDATYVTRDGATLCPSRRAIFGTATDADAGALERKRQIRALESGMSGLEEAFANHEKTCEDTRSRLDDLRSQLAKADGELARLRGEIASATSELGRLEQQVNSAVNERKRITAKRDEALSKAAKAKEQLAGHKKAATEAKADADALSSKLREARSERDRLAEAEQRAAAKVSQTKLDLATVTERRRHLEVKCEELDARVKELDERRAATERSARSLEVLRLRVDPLHERYEAIHEVAVAWAARLRDTASLAEADSDSLKKTIGDAKEAQAKAARELEGVMSGANEVKVALGKLEVQVEAAIQDITSSGTYTLEDALALPVPEDREALEREVAKLTRQLADIGPVNQVAMDEYTRLKERSDYIHEQVEDLERTRAALTKITSAIERKMRRAFLMTFDAVNTNFQEVFGLLFPGGSAHLEMTDPDHLTETGIEIVAQPRGKRIAKMTLMSGGEKSLTALALLFAVYRTRTVPFYVFDEVEAALDDSNLDKLLGAIESLKDTTQLIVISHQRRTMEQADVLYGVSMQADGVSHVVSQRLDQTTGKVVDA